MELTKSFISSVTNLVIEGNSVVSAMQLLEARIDAADIDNFTKSSFFKNLEKNAMSMLKKVEDADGYRKRRRTNPKQFVQDELEDLEYVSNIIDGLVLANFPKEVQAPIYKLSTSAKNGVSRGEKKLGGFDTPEKILAGFTSLDYTKRALATLTDLFKILNIPWNYNFEWENYLNATDPTRSKNKATRDADGNRQIDYKVPESRQRELALIAVSADAEELENLDSVLESVNLSENEESFIKALWNKLMGGCD